ncbi:MAG: single-strand DNA-binding protein [Actinomycetota bacterium]|jgi:hypothetical protein|nr:single-strand DNA-binding protein [Actinomycetota bacterium]MDQ1502134.1 single-strand DNA-binding protein [Actinomycetota bacterium]MDQ1502672.1 single-strand DNA-binding protein [Actinomycetota bacterium]MDQ1566055.1 single-strand DNA-binding protein [Actinomycetota bacterium]
MCEHVVTPALAKQDPSAPNSSIVRARVPSPGRRRRRRRSGPEPHGKPIRQPAACVVLAGWRPGDGDIGAGHQRAGRECVSDTGGAPRDQRNVVFLEVVPFDSLAKTVSDHLTKGRQVAVTGRLEQNEWTAKDGSKRSRIQVMADTCPFYRPRRPRSKACSPSPSGVGSPLSGLPTPFPARG